MGNDVKMHLRHVRLRRDCEAEIKRVLEAEGSSISLKDALHVHTPYKGVNEPEHVWVVERAPDRGYDDAREYKMWQALAPYIAPGGRIEAALYEGGSPILWCWDFDGTTCTERIGKVVY